MIMFDLDKYLLRNIGLTKVEIIEDYFTGKLFLKHLLEDFEYTIIGMSHNYILYFAKPDWSEIYHIKLDGLSRVNYTNFSMNIMRKSNALQAGTNVLIIPKSKTYKNGNKVYYVDFEYCSKEDDKDKRYEINKLKRSLSNLFDGRILEKGSID